MDRESREKYPHFADNWANLGYDDLPQPPNLTENVHPLLKATKFDGSKEAYEAMKPAIQLASNYLYSPNSCMFVYSVVYGQRKAVASTHNIGGHSFKAGGKEVKVGGRPCADVVKTIDFSMDKVSHVWRQIALHCRFGPRSMPGLLGRCMPMDKDGADLQGNGCHGHAISIAFDRKFLDDIETLTSSGKAQSLEMLNVQFALATVLCHEAGHAVEYARNGEWRREVVFARINQLPKPLDTNEPFYDGQHTAELGFALENEIFGGIFLKYLENKPQTCGQITDWPDGWYHYSKSSYPMGNRNAPPKVDMFESFLLDMKYVQRVFRQDFWDSLANISKPADRGHALKIPKTVGIWRCAPAALKKLSPEEKAEFKHRQSLKIIRTPSTQYEVQALSSGEEKREPGFLRRAFGFYLV